VAGFNGIVAIIWAGDFPPLTCIKSKGGEPSGVMKAKYEIIVNRVTGPAVPSNVKRYYSGPTTQIYKN
jgi:hypothetical protein